MAEIASQPIRQVQRGAGDPVKSLAQGHSGLRQMIPAGQVILVRLFQPIDR